MSAADQTVDPRLQQVINKMLGQASGEDQSGMVDIPIEVLVATMQHLEMGMIELSQSQQMMASAIDTARLSMQMVMRILVEKELLTEDEIKAKYEEEVVKPMNDIHEKIRAKMASAIQAAKNQESPVIEPVETEKASQEDEPEVESDIVLASERAGSPKVFAGDEEG